MVGLTEGSFEESYAISVLGVDALYGGNPRHPSGAGRAVSDGWVSDYDLPEVHTDPFVEEDLRENGGVLGCEDTKGIMRFLARHDIYGHLERCETMAAEFDDPDRSRYVLNQITGLKMLHDNAVRIAHRNGLGSFEERYRAATSLDLGGLTDVAAKRAVLLDALRGVGYANDGRNVSEIYREWARENAIPVNKIGAFAKRLRERFIGLAREHLLAHIDLGIEEYGAHLEDVPLNGQEITFESGMRFTGFNLYDGGVDESGRPQFKGEFQYNTEHPLSFPGLISLVAHETVPGHYLASVTSDLLHRDGRLPFEATMMIMGTPVVTLAEGWAKNTLALLSPTKDHLGFFGELLGHEFDGNWARGSLEQNLLVGQAAEALEDAAKHDAAILVQRDGIGEKELERKLREEYALPEHLVAKIKRQAKNPLGSAYGPSYETGKAIVADAIKEHGKVEVARVGLGLEGIVDIDVFKTKMSRKVAVG